MPERYLPPASLEPAPAPANRAERRAKGGARSPLRGNAGKVRRVRFDHATDPRQYAAHRRG